ncbi:MAG: AAA family ATPase, partial [Streptosporangiales bacterium]|nr:AAA family ATPase [Streptosporangiales bacterium]
MVGRAAEQSRINRLVADAKDGRSRSLVLRGEAGIGKSALLDYAESVAGGMRVLRVVGVESEAEVAYAAPQAVVGAAQDLLGVVDGWHDPLLVDRPLAELGGVAGGVHRTVPAAGRHRTCRAEVEAGHVRVRGERHRLQAEQAGGRVVAGEAAERHGVLAARHGDVPVLHGRRCGVAGGVHAVQALHAQVEVHPESSQSVASARDVLGERACGDTGGPHHGAGGQPCATPAPASRRVRTAAAALHTPANPPPIIRISDIQVLLPPLPRRGISYGG